MHGTVHDSVTNGRTVLARGLSSVVAAFLHRPMPARAAAGRGGRLLVATSRITTERRRAAPDVAPPTSAVSVTEAGDNLEAFLRHAVDTWTEADETGVDVASVYSYLVSVSLALIDSPDTDRNALLRQCEARALPVDPGASMAVLRARLVAFNLSTQSVWCSSAACGQARLQRCTGWSGPSPIFLSCH